MEGPDGDASAAAGPGSASGVQGGAAAGPASGGGIVRFSALAGGAGSPSLRQRRDGSMDKAEEARRGAGSTAHRHAPRASGLGWSLWKQ